VRLTRRYPFCASHRLHSAQLSDEQNQSTYGKCNHPFGHGHNYVVEVSVSGAIDEQTGRVVDLEKLDSLVMQQVIARYDYRNLNEDVEEFRSQVPTTEVVGIEIANRLSSIWPDQMRGESARLERIRIWETERNIFEVRV
jgi:6-pyruvoyltetrahydropterin/6-carboxytetrahydropterin synthase